MRKIASSLAIAMAMTPAAPAMAARAPDTPAVQPASVSPLVAGPLAPVTSAPAAGRGGDFIAHGVKIRATPRLDGYVRGHGNPGDGYTWNGGQSFADPVTCPNGDVLDHWTYVINNRTKVEGYVSDCFIKEHTRFSISTTASASAGHQPAYAATGQWWNLRTVEQEDAIGTLWYRPDGIWHANIRDAPVGAEVSGQEEHGSRGERATVPMGESSVNTKDWYGHGSFRVCIQLPARTQVCSTYVNPGARPQPNTAAASHHQQHHHQYADFRVPGVVIWDNPLTTARRVGLGYPGQKFDAIRGSGPWDYYRCDNGVTSNFWIYGRNVATGVVGWVPDCNLTP